MTTLLIPRRWPTVPQYPLKINWLPDADLELLELELGERCAGFFHISSLVFLLKQEEASIKQALVDRGAAVKACGPSGCQCPCHRPIGSS